MQADLISFNIKCPITNTILQVVPIPEENNDINENVEEYVFVFDCPNCGIEHTVNLLDYFIKNN